MSHIITQELLDNEALVHRASHAYQCGHKRACGSILRGPLCWHAVDDRPAADLGVKPVLLAVVKPRPSNGDQVHDLCYKALVEDAVLWCLFGVGQVELVAALPQEVPLLAHIYPVDHCIEEEIVSSCTNFRLESAKFDKTKMKYRNRTWIFVDE